MTTKNVDNCIYLLSARGILKIGDLKIEEDCFIGETIDIAVQKLIGY